MRVDGGEDWPRRRVLSALNAAVQPRKVSWDPDDALSAIVTLPTGRQFALSLCEPLRLAENAATDDELRGWFEVAVRDWHPILPWAEIRDRLRWSLEPAAREGPDLVSVRISPQLQAIVVETEPDDARIRYVTTAEANQWAATRAEVFAAAARGSSRLLSAATVVVDEPVAGHVTLYFEAPSEWKASLLLAPTLRSIVSPHLGWPVLAIAPARDFLLVFSESSASFLTERLGEVVHREFNAAGYPLTREVLKRSDDGVAAIGAFGP